MQKFREYQGGFEWVVVGLIIFGGVYFLWLMAIGGKTTEPLRMNRIKITTTPVLAPSSKK